MKIIKFFLPLLLGVALSTAFAAKHGTELDYIVVVVNETALTESQLNEAVQRARAQLVSSNVSLPPDQALRKQVLDQLISKTLQMEVADRAGIQVSETDIDKAIRNIARSNNLTIQELYEKVGEQGLSVKAYRQELHDEILLQSIQQQMVGSKITITPDEVSAFMRTPEWRAFNSTEYHLEDILIALPEAPTSQDVAAAKKHADEVLAKIRGGISFQEAAVAESGQSNALQGGDLGWRKLPEIPAAFSSQLIHAKANALLGPIQTPNGFHIVRLVDVRSVGKEMTSAQQQQQVQQLIYQRKLEEALQTWTTKLRSEAFINLHPEN